MAEKEETKETEEEESETEETEASTTPKAEEVKETPKPQQPSNEIKVVIIMKAENIMLGVQSPDCDPVYKTMKGTMAEALQQVPALIKKAKQKWAANPRNPKANLPEPPPSAAPARTPAAANPSKPKAQQNFF